MATITATSALGFGARALTWVTLTGTDDTFAYNASKRPILFLRNPTGGAISPVIDGDGASTVSVNGVGPVDVSSGYAVGSIAAGAAVAIPLASIAEYLAGDIEITSGTDLEGALLEY